MNDENRVQSNLQVQLSSRLVQPQLYRGTLDFNRSLSKNWSVLIANQLSSIILRNCLARQ